MNPSIYKILTRTEYELARDRGEFYGSKADLADGYIHFSTLDQLRRTCEKHFSALAGLVVLEVAAAALPAAHLRFEPSRGGDLFPHLYAPLDMGAVTGVYDLPLGRDGKHDFSGLPPIPAMVEPGRP